MNETAMPPPYKVLNLEKYKEKGAEVVYKKPKWIENWEPIVFPELPPKKKIEKRVYIKRIDYGLK